ncbi:MAG: hypothetical protein SPL86_04590 [Succiniclasticum sp.]|uniref:hypothetical protein n=1 Tax=Succiniclasticum sp. TaxID=2775030 RepID=UPI001B2568AD|nr:hypothetical protein [Succiniclasticum sp.]MBO5638127.1 hypothetical protein [Acidaminococcaceae bacterium]MBR1494329.1 hypothetical protein [Acidaminococcaceae bacterium]MBR1660860.1 hypothetical protein [Acidaminococcaceae bacterium]MDY6290745.1 hypothetical protein [Succiniclasticum sp.]
MSGNAADVLNRGMECLLEKMGIVEAEQFIFLIKSDGFDYTKWQREYFGNKSKEQLDKEMDAYFAENTCKIDPAKII